MESESRIADRDAAIDYILSSSNDELNQLVSYIQERRKSLKSLLGAQNNMRFQVGSPVKFLHRKNKAANAEGYITGILTKKYRTKCEVKVQSGVTWKLNMSLLEDDS